MLAFGIISILVMILIYFALKVQTLQKELASSRHVAKTNARKVNFTCSNLAKVGSTVQETFLTRLETARTKGLISEAKYPPAEAIIKSFTHVILECSEKDATVEEALNRILTNTDVSMDAVKEFIKEQPSEVRVAWVKNTPDGFIAACNHLTNNLLGLKAKSSEPASQ